MTVGINPVRPPVVLRGPRLVSKDEQRAIRKAKREKDAADLERAKKIVKVVSIDAAGGRKAVNNYLKGCNGMYYARPAIEFNEEEAILLAYRSGKPVVVVEKL